MKLKVTYETEVRPYEPGYVVIYQPDPAGGEASIVLFSTCQARLVAQELVRLAEELEEAFDVDE